MHVGGPTVRIAESYAKTLNSNSQKSINPTSPEYHKAMGDKNMASVFARLGPDTLYAHIMKAAFDPVYGREFSLAQQYERPATNFPLAEDRQHEGSQNNAFIDILGGVHFKPKEGFNPFKDTRIIYDAKSPKKQKQFYNSYDRSYGGYNSRLKVNPQLIMPIYGDSNSNRRKKGKKKGAIYNPEGIVTEDIYSMPTLEEFDQLVKLKNRVKNTKNSQTLEQRVELLTN